MPSVDVNVPPLVRQRAEANSSGTSWLASLPEVLGAVADRWNLTLGEPFVGGTAGLVIAADRHEADGRLLPCVVKIPLLLDMHESDAVAHAVTTHRVAAGRGCAELLDFDAEFPALLLERLGPNLHERDPARSVDEVLDAIATAFLDFWRDASSDPTIMASGLMSGADKAHWLANYIETTSRALGQPMSAATIGLALECCAERAHAHDPTTAVLCHGDAHGWNTLEAGGGRYKFVDPEGIVAERAADLGVPMREYNEPLLDGDTTRLVRRRAERLGDSCGVDPDAIWQWGHMERVATGLANLADFGADDAAPFLEVAERCAASGA